MEQPVYGDFSQLSWIRLGYWAGKRRFRAETRMAFTFMRLANPNLPFNVTEPIPAKYNPYVTVDYFSQIQQKQ